MKITTSTERLKELLNSDARSYTSIASELNVSKQIVSAWANGRRSPKKTTLAKIAEIYNVSIDWLMGFDVEKNETIHKQPDPEIQIVSAMMESMSAEQRQQVIDLVKILIKAK